MKTKLLLIGLIGLLFCSGMGTKPNVPDADYLDAGRNFDSVVAIESPTFDGRNARGSGVIISEKWVLTAGHVLYGMSSPVIRFRGKPYLAKRKILHPSFVPSVEAMEGDIALIELQEPVPLKDFPDLGGNYTAGEIVDIVGRGTFGVAGSPQRRFDAQCRAGTQVIDRSTKTVIFTSMSPIHETERECIVTGGDSGGGLFNKQKLIGIHMHCDGPTAEIGGYGDRSAHTAVEPYIPWIKENISQQTAEEEKPSVSKKFNNKSKSKKRFKPK